MNLKERRKQHNLTQRDLALMSGVNFRSLQDYEQGHKKLSAANGDTLLRLATVLGCSLQELLLEDFPGAPLASSSQMDASDISGRRFYCEKYQTAGCWVCNDQSVAILFYYKGCPYLIPFEASFQEKHIPWLKEAAILQMEAKIEDILFSREETEAW